MNDIMSNFIKYLMMLQQCEYLNIMTKSKFGCLTTLQDDETRHVEICEFLGLAKVHFYWKMKILIEVHQIIVFITRITSQRAV